MPMSSDRAMMDPPLAIAASLIYCLLAKARTRPGDLIALIHRLADELPPTERPRTGSYALIGRALAYVERTPMSRFAQEAAAMLDEHQRLCILLNILEHSVADGQLDPREHELLDEVQRAFGLPEDRMLGYSEAIYFKNIRTAFGAHAPLRIAA